MPPVTFDNAHDVIRHHAPSDEEIVRISKIRDVTESFIKTVLLHVPDCADRSAAIRHAREAMMNANAAIVLKGLV